MNKYHRRLIEWLVLTRLRFHTFLVRLSPRVSVGKGTTIAPDVRFKFESEGRIIIGAGCRIENGVVFEVRTGIIEIGNDVTVNPYALINGTFGVRIGDHCRIATHAVIVSGNHGVAPDQLVRRQPMRGRGITIDKDVWIAANTVILDGVSIPRGCVIAAGAVVTPKPMDEMAIYGGVPAKMIGSRLSRASQSDE